MLRTWRFVLCWVAACFLVVPCATASPHDQYLQIYLSIQEAEKAEFSGQRDEALKDYQSCLNQLEKLQKGFPDFEPVIVRYRISFCRERIQSLQKDLKKEGTSVASSSSSSKPSSLEDIVEDQPKETKGSKETSVTPTTASKEISSNDSSLKTRVQELETDLADTKKKLADSKDEASKLKTQLEDAQTAASKVASGSSSEAVAALQEQLRKVQDGLAMASKEREVLQNANDDFKKKLEEAQTKLAAAPQGGAASERENKILRGIVKRLLEEQNRRATAKRLAMDELEKLKVTSTTLQTQIDLMGSPSTKLTAEESAILESLRTSVTTVEGGSQIAAPLESTSSTASIAAPDYSAKPIVPQEFRDTAAQAAKLFADRKFEEAAAKYQAILNAYPDSLYALSNLGVVRFQQQNYPAAEKALRAAVKQSSQDSFSHSILGIVLYQQGKFDEAVQVLTRAVALDPKDPKTHNYLGISASQKGWQEAAEKECRTAVELDDNYGDAHFNLAVIYATRKPPAKDLAQRHYQRALELNIPKDAQLEKLLGS
ncbi:MAG: tetratricopeptide repeat protein [bacterium]